MWTAIAGVIAFTNYKNGFSDESVATHEIIIEDGIEISERFIERVLVGNVVKFSSKTFERIEENEI